MPRVENEYRLGTPGPVMLFEFSVTSWCNYTCSYCVTTVHLHRPESFHAFDFHPVERWVEAFERVPHDFSLVCRGGEPFLDHENFARFLGAVGRLPRLKYMRVDTNGAWDPRHYDAVSPEIRRSTQLNVSFHPTQITLERFKKRLHRIVEAGWEIGMINYVMEAAQADDYEGVRDYFQKEYGLYVNPNPDAFDAAWANPLPEARREGRNKFASLLPLADVMQKTGAPTHGKRCFFPSISYFIGPNGMAQRACGARVADEGRQLDFIRDSAQVRPLPSPVRCPMRSCLCLDRYAFLEELEGRGRTLNLLAEYVHDCRSHQEEASRNGGGVGKALAFLSTLFRRRLPVVESASAPRGPELAKPHAVDADRDED